MPITANTVEELRRYLIEAATTLGTAFLFGPMPTGKKTLAGWHDAWFDASIPGLLKLNCFFKVPGKVYDEVKTTNWSPVVNKIVDVRPKYNSDKGGQDKGAWGKVICNGDATPASMGVMGVLGSDQKDEHFETALYENWLYKPPLMNLELKLVSNKTGYRGKPVESIVVNAHIGQ